ncbi:MAG: hypothetical protein ABL995_20825 [Bryobacteraceae bacterium]
MDSDLTFLQKARYVFFNVLGVRQYSFSRRFLHALLLFGIPYTLFEIVTTGVYNLGIKATGIAILFLLPPVVAVSLLIAAFEWRVWRLVIESRKARDERDIHNK